MNSKKLGLVAFFGAMVSVSVIISFCKKNPIDTYKETIPMVVEKGCTYFTLSEKITHKCERELGNYTVYAVMARVKRTNKNKPLIAGETATVPFYCGAQRSLAFKLE